MFVEFGKDKLIDAEKVSVESIFEGILEIVNEEELDVDELELGEDVGEGEEEVDGDGLGEGETVEVLFAVPLVGDEKITHPPVASGFRPADCSTPGGEISPLLP